MTTAAVPAVQHTNHVELQPGGPDRDAPAWPAGNVALGTDQDPLGTLHLLDAAGPGGGEHRLGGAVLRGHGPAHGRGHRDFNAAQPSLTGQVALGELIIVVLGALVITSEYSTGMIRTSLAVMPRRGRAVRGQGDSVRGDIAYGLAGHQLRGILHRAGDPGQQAHQHYAGTAHVLRAVLLSAAIVTVFGLLAYGTGAIIRHTAGAITVDNRSDLTACRCWLRRCRPLVPGHASGGCPAARRSAPSTASATPHVGLPVLCLGRIRCVLRLRGNTAHPRRIAVQPPR